MHGFEVWLCEHEGINWGQLLDGPTVNAEVIPDALFILVLCWKAIWQVFRDYKRNSWEALLYTEIFGFCLGRCFCVGCR